METKIEITGQINGNTMLWRKCGRCDHWKNLPFNGYVLYYSSKEKATKALAEAYKDLKNDTPISYSRGSFLRYDTSIAKIIVYKIN